MLAALTAVAAFLVAVALFPFYMLGAWVSGFLPPGNPLGVVGDALNTSLRAGMGFGSVAVPLGLLAAAASFGKWFSRPWRKRIWIVTLASGLLLPLAAFLAGEFPTDSACSGTPPGEDDWASGYLGSKLLGRPICRMVGWPGAWLLVGGGVVVTSVVAFGFNPLRFLLSVVAKAFLGIGLCARAIGSTARRWRRRFREQRDASRKAASLKAVASDAPAKGEVSPRTRQALVEIPESGDSSPANDSPAPEADNSISLPSRGGVPATGGVSAISEEDTSEDGEGISEDELPPGDRPLPSLALLTAAKRDNQRGTEQELDRLGEVLVETLRTFNIRSEIGGRTTGPAVTQYEVVPAAGTKVNRIANLDADLALAMKARSIRIVAPIPGKGAVGVEIPNPRPEVVRLREILGAPAFSRSGGLLPLGLGKDLGGEPFVADLTKMPHALIAGATGSGKSVCLNTVITSLVYRNGPDVLRLLLIDPKMVELSAYGDLPHLRHPVVTNPRDAAGVLKWAVLEMERRYALLSANGVRSLKEFNERVRNGVVLKRAAPDEEEAAAGGEIEGEDPWIYEDGPLPYIVVVVDELADLMMTVQAEVEKPLTQLAQKARAIGIHLLVATQRPSVNVITGLIKANFPCRIAFRVASKTDSRTILDQNGAEALLGQGDMLFLPPGQGEPVRMQGAFISTEETEALMGWYREQAETFEAVKARVTSGEGDILEAVRAMDEEGGEGEGVGIRADWDPLFRKAALACIQQKAGSTSLLQRRLRIGYGRAARIVDQLHDAGVLGPPDGSKPREVMVGPDGLDEICPG